MYNAPQLAAWCLAHLGHNYTSLASQHARSVVRSRGHEVMRSRGHDVQDDEEPQPRQPGAAEPVPVAASVVPQGCRALRQVHGDAGQGERAHSLQEETAEVTCLQI